MHQGHQTDRSTVIEVEQLITSSYRQRGFGYGESGRFGSPWVRMARWGSELRGNPPQGQARNAKPLHYGRCVFNVQHSLGQAALNTCTYRLYRQVAGISGSTALHSTSVDVTGRMIAGGGTLEVDFDSNAVQKVWLVITSLTNGKVNLALSFELLGLPASEESSRG